MSVLIGRDPTPKEFEHMSRRAIKKQRRGVYTNAIMKWYYETTTPFRVFDVTTEKSGTALFSGLKASLVTLGLELKVKVRAHKDRHTHQDRVYLERLYALRT